MKEIIAIDPGKTGAICRLTLNTDFSIKEFVVEPSLFNKKTARFDSDNLFYFLKFFYPLLTFLFPLAKT